MPVSVQCFQCNAILDLDDGFRGGVCRCSNCGTLLQVPRGDDTAPTAPKKVRPAMPPSPTSPTTPLQNATSSRLDVGLSRGLFENTPSSSPMRRDLGISSGPIHPTTPIHETPAKSRRRPGTAPPPTAKQIMPATPPKPRAQAHHLLWLGLLLAILITAVLSTLVIYYLWYYEPALP